VNVYQARQIRLTGRKAVHPGNHRFFAVTKSTPAKKIKDAYRTLALKYHPDRNNSDPQAAEQMKAVNEAYAVLSDPKKKQAYDALHDQFGSSAYSHFRQNYTEKDIFSGSDINRILDEMARSFGFRGVDDIFKEFYLYSPIWEVGKWAY